MFIQLEWFTGIVYKGWISEISAVPVVTVATCLHKEEKHSFFFLSAFSILIN